jgi:hypothetical protein
MPELIPYPEQLACEQQGDVLFVCFPELHPREATTTHRLSSNLGFVS